jgi:hypothetical protein
MIFGGLHCEEISRRLVKDLLGVYRNEKLHFFVHSGSEFSEKGIHDALRLMKPLFTNKSPFDNPPKVKEGPMDRATIDLVCARLVRADLHRD